MEIESNSQNISFFFIDTGFKAKDSEEVLYAEFRRKNNKPGPLNDEDWTGVRIGTKKGLTAKSETEATDNKSLDNYTAIRDYRLIARKLYELTGKDFSVNECKEILQKSYEEARSKESLGFVENQYDNQKQISFFELINHKSIKGSRLFVKMDVCVKMM